MHERPSSVLLQLFSLRLMRYHLSSQNIQSYPRGLHHNQRQRHMFYRTSPNRTRNGITEKSREQSQEMEQCNHDLSGLRSIRLSNASQIWFVCSLGGTEPYPNVRLDSSGAPSLTGPRIPRHCSCWIPTSSFRWLTRAVRRSWTFGGEGFSHPEEDFGIFSRAP